MNIRDFEYLIAVDELKSFIKASQKCFISQPALSQQIKKIEDQIGIKIFERNKKNIITTASGNEVIKYAKEIVSNYDKVKSISEEFQKVKIGLIPTICPYLLPHIVDDLNKRFSSTRFYFSELKTEYLLEKLKKGEVDFGIIAHFSYLIDDKINYYKLYDEEFLLALNKESNLTQKDFCKILEDRKLILLEEGNCMSDNIKDICAVHSYESFNDFFATNIETVKNMIRINNGAGLLPELACLDERNLKLSPFETKKYREVGLVTRANFYDNNLAKEISNLIQDSISNIIY